MSTVKNKKEKKGVSFSERVIACALAIPFGRVTTYGRIARASGAGPMASQSITSILGRAHERGEAMIPFHRIVYADGSVFISEEYKEKRLKAYKKEGIEINEKSKIKDFNEKVFEFA